MMKFLQIAMLSAVMSIANAAAAKEDYYPLTDLSQTSAMGVLTEITSYKGKQSTQVIVAPDHKDRDQGGCDSCTFLNLDAIDFHNGVIEIEVASTIPADAPQWARGFVGIVFRVDKAKKHYEALYLRPSNASETQQILRNHTVQYISYPDHPWYDLRKQHQGHYESFAPVTLGEWTKLKIEVEDQVARLYVNGAEYASLIVSDLKLGGEAAGSIGLLTEPATVAYFRNLKVTHR